MLKALSAEPENWRYGYELGRQVGLKAGSLYPILMRLTERGLLEARWEQQPPPGPPRHLYRLTSTGLALAATVEAAQAGPETARRAFAPQLDGA